MQLIDLQRPHPITAPPLLSPPAWLACASPRPWGPGIRLESRFQECHLPLLMVLIIGTGWRAGSGGAEADSLLRLPPQRCSTREAGRSWHRAGAGAGAAEAAAEFHNVRLALPLSAAFMQAGLWRRARGRVVMGSEDAKSGRGGGGGGGGWGANGKSQLPALPLCTKPRVYLSGTQSPLWLTRKGGPCSPTCFQSRTLQEAEALTPLPRETWQSLPSVGTSPAGSLARGSS